MHPELEAALAAILRDFDVPAGLAPSVTDEAWQDHPETASVLLTGPDDFSVGVWMHLGRPMEPCVNPRLFRCFRCSPQATCPSVAAT